MKLSRFEALEPKRQLELEFYAAMEMVTFVVCIHFLFSL